MSRKHLVLMLALCLIPVVIIAVLFASGAALSTPLLVALIALCPLSHLLMMGLMSQDSHHPETSDPRNNLS